MKIPTRVPSGRGALLIIALLFGSSAVVRLGAGSGQAIAKGVANLAENEPEQSIEQCEPVVGIGKLVAAISERENLLTTRERELQELEQSLSLAKDQFRINMAALIKAESKLSATIAQSESAAEDDLERLTAVYENMKPKEAATLFEEMNPTFAAGFIGRMRPDAAALLLAGLSPQTAYSISVILAGRNANTPTE